MMNVITEQKFYDYGWLMLDAIPAICSIWNEQGEIIDCNLEAIKSLELDSKEEYRDGFSTILSPSLQPDGEPSAAKSKRLISLAFETGYQCFEWTHLTKSGKELPVKTTLKRVLCGNDRMIVSHSYDLTQEKETQTLMKYKEILMEIAEDLLTNEQKDLSYILNYSLPKLANVVKSNSISIWLNYESDKQLCARRIAAWNRNFSGDKHKGENITIDYENYVPQFLIDNYTPINEYVENLPKILREFILISPYKTLLLLPIRIEGQFCAFVGISRDEKSLFTSEECKVLNSCVTMMVTAILRNEKILQIQATISEAIRNANAKNNFLSRMSHEIRTPLNAIIGMVTISNRTDDIVQVKECMNKISLASEQLLNIINDVLDMTKIEADKLTLEHTEFSIDSLLSRVENIVCVSMADKNQHFDKRIDFPKNYNIISDELRLSQVLINLLNNACKFTPNGGSILLYITHFNDAGSDKLRFAVKDNGIGIGDGSLEKVFGYFEQGDDSITRKYGGSGLGLSITKHIVEAMGGEIDVESEPDKGSRFFFEIPVELTLPSDEKKSLPEHNVQPANWSNKHILLTEDIEINRDIVIALLEHTNIHIDCALNGKEALDLISANPSKYDLVLMDVQMPVMDGLTATKLIRKLDSEDAKRIPICAMTANAFKEDRDACMNAGMNTHIAKPIDYNVLIQTLRIYLN